MIDLDPTSPPSGGGADRDRSQFFERNTMTTSATTIDIDILRNRIARDTAALRATPPWGFGSHSPAEMRDDFNFIRGMIHAYRVMTNFSANDSINMMGDADAALKTARKTLRDWRAENLPPSGAGFGPEIHLID